MSVSDPLSFLPEDYLEQKAQRRTNVICAVLAGIVMGAIGFAFSYTQKANKSAELRHTAVEQQYAVEARKIQTIDEIEAKQEQMTRRAELASSLLEKIPRSNVLAEVTNCVPPDTSLVEFTLTSVRHGPTVNPQNSAAKPSADAIPEPIVYDVTLKVTGTAANDVQVAEFIRRLGRSPLFKDVNLDIISDQQSITPQKIRHFQIEMTLNNDADVRKLGTLEPGNASAQLPAN